MADDSKGGFLVIEADGTTHLPTTRNGKVDHDLCGAAWAALFSPSGHRGKPYEGPHKEDAQRKLRKIYEEQGWDMPVAASERPRLFISLEGVILSEQGKLVRTPIFILCDGYKGAQHVKLTRDDWAHIVANLRKRKRLAASGGDQQEAGDIVLDYEHASVYFPELAAEGKAPAAGWIREIQDSLDEHGVGYVLVDFTEKARDLIRTREMKFTSPVIERDVIDRETGKPQGATLTSAALTTQPFLVGLPAVHLSEGWTLLVAGEKSEPLASGDLEPRQQAPLKERMMSKSKVTPHEDGKQLHVECAECGKKTLADMPEGMRLAASDRQPRVITLSEVKTGANGLRDFAGHLRTHAGEGVLIAADLVAAEIAQRDAVIAVDKAVTETKILPAQREQFLRIALSDRPAFDALVATLKPQVDTTIRGVAGNEKDMSGAGGELAQLDQQFEDAVRVTMSERKLDRANAMALVASEHADLAERRRKLISGRKQ